jgi:formate dehydrogenase (NADP+) beta subunit
MPQPTDLTVPPDLTQKRQTGAMRMRRPVYVDLLPPCNNACPAGENIQEWLAHAQAGRFREAWERSFQDNPLPAVHGRVCYHPCESATATAPISTARSASMRSNGFSATWLWKRAGFRRSGDADEQAVLVVGAGPSGLSAAHHLALMGHTVEIFDAGPVAGGMMHFGIPAYRLPRDILDGGIKRIERMGVKIVSITRWRIWRRKGSRNFDAVFVAVGAHLSKKIDIPGRDAGKMLRRARFSQERGNGRRSSSGAASRFTAAATRRWTPRARQSVLATSR